MGWGGRPDLVTAGCRVVGQLRRTHSILHSAGVLHHPTLDSLFSRVRTALTPETRARARAVAGTIRTDGATVTAALLLDAGSRRRSPVST